MISRANAERGSSFIELLAAVTIFAIVVLGLSPSLLSTRKVAGLGKNQSVAATLAEDKIEQIRTLSPGAVTSGSDGPLKPDGTSGGIFNRAWTVTGNTPMLGVSRVVVTVSWRERPSDSSVTLATLIPQ
jgi:type II secretory pathway pseudopilin PulG